MMPSPMGILFTFNKVMWLEGVYQSHYYKILIFSRQIYGDILIHYIVFVFVLGYY